MKRNISSSKVIVSGYFKDYFSDCSTLGLIVLILTVIAMYLLGEVNKISYLVFTLAQCIQIYVFLEKRQGFLILTMLFLIVMNVVNYFKWS